MSTLPRDNRRRDALLAATGAAWAGFVLPPVLVAWSGSDAPAWARHIAAGQPYDWIRSVGDRLGAPGDYERLGAPGDYEVFGVLIAPAFVLIGLALLPRARVAGRWTAVLAWLTLLGAPIVTLSYVGHALPDPWHAMWGLEIQLLTAMAICGIVAGVFAFRSHQLPLWWAALLGATIGVLIISSVLFAYFPHGTLIGFGIEVAVLALGEPTRQGSSPAPAAPSA